MEDINLPIALKDWVRRFKQELISRGLLGSEPWNSYLSEVAELINLLDDPVVLGQVAIEKVDKIDASGMGRTILNMLKAGLTPKEMVDTLRSYTGMDISAEEIKGWVDNYNHSCLSDRPSIVRGSVFETRGRLEEIHLLVQKHLETIELTEDESFAKAKTTKAQVQLEVYKELRQLYKDANQLVTSVQQLNTIREFQEVVLDVVSNISPQAYHQILKELKERKALMNNLLPDM
jgi:hypothetical protein